jgi:hypothetical protein
VGPCLGPQGPRFFPPKKKYIYPLKKKKKSKFNLYFFYYYFLVLPPNFFIIIILNLYPPNPKYWLHICPYTKRMLVMVKKYSAIRETICAATTIGSNYCTNERISTTSTAQHDHHGNK